MKENEIIKAYDEGVKKIITIITGMSNTIDSLKSEIAELKSKILELEVKANKNSKNSSLTPSSDIGKKKINNREKSNRKIGGQPDHEGKTLEKVENPDEIIDIKVSEMCDCGYNLSDIEGIIKIRQKFDIPEIKKYVSEYRTHEKLCPKCGKIHVSNFPSDVTQPVEYGDNIRALMNYFVNYQLIPVERTAEAISDIVGQKVSKGTIVNETKRFSKKIDETVSIIKNKIISSNVVHFDETGLRSCGKTNWMHVASTENLTHYSVHEKRGNEASNDIGILPNFEGTAVHDHWKPYYKYTDCSHAECNSHNLRHCKNVVENYKQDWANDMAALFIEINRRVKDLKEAGFSKMDEDEINKYFTLYNGIIEKGLIEDEEKSLKRFNKKGKLLNSTPRNLLTKFKEYDLETLAFMFDFNVPFDNNLGERDIRMQKLRQKISGCFRGKDSAAIFCKIRSYISTARKNGKSAMESIRMALKGQPFIPNS
jgi:transposase